MTTTITIDWYSPGPWITLAMFVLVALSGWATNKLQGWGERPEPVKEILPASVPAPDLRYDAFVMERLDISLPRRKPLMTLDEHIAASTAIGRHYLMMNRGRDPRPYDMAPGEMAFVLAQLRRRG